MKNRTGKAITAYHTSDKRELFKKSIIRELPERMKKSLTEEFLDDMFNIQEDGLFLDALRENFLTYTNILIAGKYSLEEYSNAIRFITHKLMGYSDVDSYIKTFPERYERICSANEELSEKEIRGKVSSYASMFKSSKIVTGILEQTIIPSWILYAPVYNKAIEELVKVVSTARSEIAKVNACGLLLQHTKPPEVKKLQLDIGVQTSNSIEQLKQTVSEFAKMQLEQIKAGTSVKEIAEKEIVEIMAEEV